MTVRRDAVGAGVLLPALVGGLVAAVVGGVVWGYIVELSDYEIGIVAWGIGALAAFGVLLATRHRRGLPLQVIAIVAALVGILVGKYVAFALVNDLAVLDGDSFTLFREFREDVFGLFDLLWIGFAVVTAFRLLAPRDEEPVVADVGDDAPLRPVEPEREERPRDPA